MKDEALISIFCWSNINLIFIHYPLKSVLQGGWISSTSPCVLAQVYTSDCILIKDMKRLCVQTSNIQYAFVGVVCGKQTSNQKPGYFVYNQWKNREIADIQNQEINQVLRKIKLSAHWGYQYLWIRIICTKHKSSPLSKHFIFVHNDINYIIIISDFTDFSVLRMVFLKFLKWKKYFDLPKFLLGFMWSSLKMG